MNSLFEALKSWSESTDSRAKLQQAYLASAVALLVIAGMVGLVNYNFGQQILLLALIAGAIFIINAVAWALLQSFILLHIDSSNKTPDDTEDQQEIIEEEPKPKKSTKSTKTSKTTKATKK